MITKPKGTRDIYGKEAKYWQYVSRVIDEVMEKYNYTYNGIAQSLHYFYNVKGNDIKKANNAISIVPYVYLDAFNYFYDLY